MKAPYPIHLHQSHSIPPIAMRERGAQPIPFHTAGRSLAPGELPNETYNTATTDDGSMPIRTT